MPPRFGVSAVALVAPKARTAPNTDFKPKRTIPVGTERRKTVASLNPRHPCIPSSLQVIVSSWCAVQLVGCLWFLSFLRRLACAASRDIIIDACAIYLLRGAASPAGSYCFRPAKLAARWRLWSRAMPTEPTRPSRGRACSSTGRRRGADGTRKPDRARVGQSSWRFPFVRAQNCLDLCPSGGSVPGRHSMRNT